MRVDALSPYLGETWTPESGPKKGAWSDEPLLRTGALLGAGAALLFALRSRRPVAVAGAAMAAFPLAVRGLVGRWPFTEAPNGAAVAVGASLRIMRAPEDVFDAWRNFRRLPESLKYVLRVTEIGPGRTEWVVRSPAGGEVCLRSVLVQERRPHVMRWHSLPDSDVEQRGSIDFRAGRDGSSTRVFVRLDIVPPPGARAAGKVFRDVLAAQLREDLRRFRDHLESSYGPDRGSAGPRTPVSPLDPF